MAPTSPARASSPQTHPVIGDPAFVDPAADDYHLTIASAARDAGDPAGVPPAPSHDADNVPRPQGPRVDIGAYEWKGHWLHLPMVFRSGAPRVGWAIGWDENFAAAIAHTADGGLTWQAQGDLSAWTDVQGTDISAVDDLTAWATLGSGGPGAASGAILHTTDGGATWVTQTIPAGLSGGMKSVKGLSRREAWAASLTGTILHTIDGGSTWNVVSHPTAPITQVNRMDAMGAECLGGRLCRRGRARLLARRRSNVAGDRFAGRQSTDRSCLQPTDHLGFR